MIARWVSPTDPMTTPETTDINANVRGNNNIVWRNLNVVDADDDGDSHVAMNVAGQRRSKRARIVFEDQTKFPRPKFTQFGEVFVSIDDKLYGYWKNSGAKLAGLTQVDNTTFRLTGSTAYLDEIALPPDYRGLIKVYFRKSQQTPASKYHFAVQHYVLDSGAPVLLGGVDYEIVKH